MIRDRSQDDWRHAWLLAIAATALGWAIQVRDGLYDPIAFVGLTIALLAALAVFLPLPLLKIDRHGPAPARWIFGGAITFNFLLWFSPHRLPGSWHGTPATPFFYLCLSLAFIISLGVIFSRHQRLCLVALLIIFCVVGGWILIRVPRPFMDVWMLQTEGLKALAHGHNPFSLSFIDHRRELYTPAAIGPGDVVHQGFPYPPIVALIELPGQLIAGDYRWANLVAMALTALLIANTVPGRVGPMAAALFLFTPRALFVLESGWTEPTTALLLAATVFCATRIPGLMPVFLGLFLCSKQYLIWALPPIILLAGPTIEWRKLIKILTIAFVAGCAVSLPLILWDIRAFLAANVDVAQGAAFRTDALSYLALLANTSGHIPSPRLATAVGFLTAIATTLLVCRRAARTPAGYAAAVATAHLVFFAFYKFAFCNYDWFLIAAFCCGAGAVRSPEWQSTLHDEKRNQLNREISVSS